MKKEVVRYKKQLESRGFQVKPTGGDHLDVRWDGARVMTLSKTPSHPKYWEKRAEGDIRRFFSNRSELLSASSVDALTSPAQAARARARRSAP